MKLQGKIFLIAVFAVTVVLAGIGFIWIQAPENRQITMNRITEKESMLLPELPENPAPALSCYSSWSDTEFQPVADTGSLAADLKQCAAAMLKAVLPEKSLIAADMQITLHNDHTATVSGRAVIPGTLTQPEQQLDYKVKVNFFANVSCEAGYPEFTPAAR